MRKAAILVALVAPAWLLPGAAFLIVGHTEGFSSLSVGSLYIWVFGACGVVGLLLCLFDGSMKTEFGAHARIVLLGAGLASAISVTAILLWWWAEMLPTWRLDVRMWLVLAVFPVLPAGLASWEIRRLARTVRRGARATRRSAWQLTAIIFVLPLLFAGARVLAEEVVIYWYGCDFLQVVVPAAENVARGKPYCVLADEGFVPGFAALDKHRILSRAIRQNLAYVRTNASTWREPHFRIVVGDTAYWWSFRDRRFYYIPGHDWSVPPATCPSDPAMRVLP